VRYTLALVRTRLALLCDRLQQTTLISMTDYYSERGSGPRSRTETEFNSRTAGRSRWRDPAAGSSTLS